MIDPNGVGVAGWQTLGVRLRGSELFVFTTVDAAERVAAALSEMFQHYTLGAVTELDTVKEELANLKLEQSKERRESELRRLALVEAARCCRVEDAEGVRVILSGREAYQRALEIEGENQKKFDRLVSERDALLEHVDRPCLVGCELCGAIAKVEVRSGPPENVAGARLCDTCAETAVGPV